MNHHLIRATFGFSLATMGFLAACGGSNQEPAVSGTGVTSAQTAQKADSAIVGKLAAARCDREQTCNNVGAGQKYASRDVCMDQMRGGLANDLNSYECPKGIDEAQLDKCMNGIRSEECSHPLDTISRMEKCRTGALCMK
ncbi:MAG: DUF6184 family natural product biosynthesis lipoprotein [Myxococcota bacterium]|nr:DUF6184 family natural product biosynthesis lipoprotein [Myxococcota bacterium]